MISELLQRANLLEEKSKVSKMRYIWIQQKISQPSLVSGSPEGRLLPEEQRANTIMWPSGQVSCQPGPHSAVPKQGKQGKSRGDSQVPTKGPDHQASSW